MSLSEHPCFVKCKQPSLLSHDLWPEHLQPSRSAAIVQRALRAASKDSLGTCLDHKTLQSCFFSTTTAPPGHQVSLQGQRREPWGAHRFCEALSRRPPSGQCTRKRCSSCGGVSSAPHCASMYTSAMNTYSPAQAGGRSLQRLASHRCPP